MSKTKIDLSKKKIKTKKILTIKAESEFPENVNESRFKKIKKFILAKFRLFKAWQSFDRW